MAQHIHFPSDSMQVDGGEGSASDTSGPTAPAGAAAPAPLNLAALLSKPKSFTGEGQSAEFYRIQAWLANVEAYFNLHNAPEPIRMEVIPTYLAGRAAAAYHSLAEQPATWASFRAWLSEPSNYGATRETPHTLTLSLLGFRFLSFAKGKDTTSLAECLQAFEALELRRGCPLDELTKCVLLLKALPSELADKARLHSIAEFSDYARLRDVVVGLAPEFTALLKGREHAKSGAAASGPAAKRKLPPSGGRPSKKPNKPSFDPASVPRAQRFMDHAQGRKMYVAGLTHALKEERMRSRTCLICGGKHMASECSEKTKLFPDRFFYY